MLVLCGDDCLLTSVIVRTGAFDSRDELGSQQCTKVCGRAPLIPTTQKKNTHTHLHERHFRQHRAPLAGGVAREQCFVVWHTKSSSKSEFITRKTQQLRNAEKSPKQNSSAATTPPPQRREKQKVLLEQDLYRQRMADKLLLRATFTF